ncbi:hypothetical protein FRC10_001977, partial [Ceratobasidium sp. 414]
MTRGKCMYARIARRATFMLPKVAQVSQLQQLSAEEVRLTCPYCRKRLRTPLGRDRHVSAHPSCRFRHLVYLRRHAEQPKRKRGREQDTGTPEPEPLEREPPAKRPRMDEDPMPVAGPSTLPPPDSRPPDPNPSDSHPPDLREASNGTFIENFPVSTAGMPIGQRKDEKDLAEYLKSCGRLGDPELFETAEILLTTGLNGRGRTKHLKGPMYRWRSRKKWKGKEKEVWGDDRELMKDVDNLPQGPKWRTVEVEVGEGLYKRTHTLYLRNLLAVIRQLLGARRFKRWMRYAPERHWVSRDRKHRIYDEMWSGDWWWRMQYLIRNKNGTIAPLIIASDETTLANNPRGAKAHPIYLTLGNISKNIRSKPTKRAMVLIGYLPVDSFEDVADEVTRRRYHGELLHQSLAEVFEPLKSASSDGILAWCSDGYMRHVYPIIAAWVADWPEQNDVACTTQSGCPKCTQGWKGRGQGGPKMPLRDRDATIEAMREYQRTKRPPTLSPLCLKPEEAFWASIPHVDIGVCLAPDLLHQIYKGMFEHARNWVEELLGTEELNRRFKSMPTAQDLRRFKNGVTTVKNWAGRESRDMARQLLLVAIDAQAHPDFIRMVRAIIDFSYLAHGAELTDVDLGDMERALGEFHSAKNVLVDGKMVRDSFDRIAKLHMLSHYVDDIHELGTPDGYSTEISEHLHIIYVKIPWRMSNRRAPFPQMVKFVRRLEAMQIHRTAIDEFYGEREGADEAEIEAARRLIEEDDDSEGRGNGVGVGEGGVGVDEDHFGAEEDSDEELIEMESAELAMGHEPTYHYPRPSIAIARRPTVRHLPGHVLISSYCAPDLIRGVRSFLSRKTSQTPILLPSDQFNVWHKATLNHPLLPFAPGEPRHRDVIRVHPVVRDKAGRIKDVGVFDTALFATSRDVFGIARFRAGRVRAIFTLPPRLRGLYSDPLVYLDVYSPFTLDATDSHRLYQTSCAHSNGDRAQDSMVLPLRCLAMACHLAPDFSSRPTFDRAHFLNNFYNHFTFLWMVYWRRSHPGRLESAVP